MFRAFKSICKLSGYLAALLLTRLKTFIWIQAFWHHIFLVQVFVKSYNKTFHNGTASWTKEDINKHILMTRVQWHRRLAMCGIFVFNMKASTQHLFVYGFLKTYGKECLFKNMCLFIAGKVLQHAVFKCIPVTSALDFCELRNLRLQQGFTLILALISNCIHYKVWDDITFHSQIQRGSCWSLEIDKLFHPTLYWVAATTKLYLFIWQGQYCVCCWLEPIWDLTHWGRYKMDAISQTTFWSAFCWIEMIEFRLKFHWNLFLRVQLTIYQHWFR